MVLGVSLQYFYWEYAVLYPAFCFVTFSDNLVFNFYTKYVPATQFVGMDSTMEGPRFQHGPRALRGAGSAAVAGVECVAGFRRACRVTPVPCLASQCVVPNVEICPL